MERSRDERTKNQRPRCHSGTSSPRHPVPTHNSSTCQTPSGETLGTPPREMGIPSAPRNRPSPQTRARGVPASTHLNSRSPQFAKEQLHNQRQRSPILRPGFPCTDVCVVPELSQVGSQKPGSRIEAMAFGVSSPQYILHCRRGRTQGGAAVQVSLPWSHSLHGSGSGNVWLAMVMREFV
jgi:hypothetical protein